MGEIEIICGPMYSGKTEELQRRLKRAIIAKQNVIAFKPQIDDRYSNDKICSHNGNTFESISINNSKEIINYLNKDINVIGIEEVQFFDKNIIDIIEQLRILGYKIICAGLDMDYLGVPFEISTYIMGIADKVDKINAICVECGNPATMSHKFDNINDNDRISVGSNNKYDALCRKCWFEKTIKTI